MSDTTDAGLQRALDLTVQMLAAADEGQWEHVVELDAERQPFIQQHRLDPRSHELLITLHQHNERLLEHAAAARGAVERELGQHQYNHRALNVYIASSE
jgi:hypothetical protein